DFKPQNVMVDGGRVVVLDFGLARLTGEASADTPAPSSLDVLVTASGAVIGTPAYMAPEQLEGRSATTRSDHFSFCVSMSQALFGRRPFGGATTADILAAMRRSPQLPPHPGAPRRPPALPF